MIIPEPRKLKSGNWFVQLRLGGKSVSVTAPTAKECKRQAELIKAEHRAGKRIDSGPDITLRQAMDNYINARRNVLSPSTIRGYNTIRDNRFKSVMNKPVKTVATWQKVVNQEAALCSAKTLKNAWLFVASVLREAGEDVPAVRLPQVVEQERPYLEPEQIPVFLDAIKGERCEVAALLALHGLRRSEVCGLTWDHVDLEAGRILVAGSVVQGADGYTAKQTNKNTSSRRFVPIMIDRLAELLQERKQDSGPVVTMYPSSYRRAVNDVCEKAGLPLVGMHGLRHSMASLFYHKGIPELYTMQIGGWSDFKTMRKIYTHIASKDMEKHVASVRDFFNGEA